MKSIVVERKGAGEVPREEKMMLNEAVARGLEVFVASEKQVERGNFVMSDDIMAVGSVSFVKHALRQLGRTLPMHTPYPAALDHLLYRSVKKVNTLMAAKQMVANGQRLFIKPASGWKRFTGFVAEVDNDIRFNGASNSKPVWVSTPVKFLSEWRVYVTEGIILDIRFADHGGDRHLRPDSAVIVDAVSALTDSGLAPAGYVIDFGVLSSGETALIELNDGFSFGAYDGLPSSVYWEVTLKRWQELVKAPVDEII
jgi:hypothetical protein